MFFLSELIFPSFFFVFDEQFDVVNVHEVVDLFLQFTEFLSSIVFIVIVIECRHCY